MKLKRISQPLFFLLISCGTQAQSGAPTIEFTYDDAGNRIKRGICHTCIVKKDPTVLETPLSKDSSIVFAELIPEVETETQSSDTTDIQKSEVPTLITDRKGGAEVSIYPNPTMGRLSIGLKNFDQVNSMQIQIIDFQGKVVLDSQSLQQFQSFDMSSLPAGTYHVDLSVNGVKGYYSVIKQ